MIFIFIFQIGWDARKFPIKQLKDTGQKHSVSYVLFYEYVDLFSLNLYYGVFVNGIHHYFEEEEKKGIPQSPVMPSCNLKLEMQI